MAKLFSSLIHKKTESDMVISPVSPANLMGEPYLPAERGMSIFMCVCVCICKRKTNFVTEDKDRIRFRKFR